MVDNPTNQYIYLPQANKFVPPNTHGAIVSMSGGQALLALFQWPPGLVPAPIIAGQYATLEAHEETLTPTGGNLQPLGSQSQQQYLGRYQFTADGSTHQSSVAALPVGTHAIALSISKSNNNTHDAYVQVYGSPDNTLYKQIGGVNVISTIPQAFYSAIMSGLSTGVYFVGGGTGGAVITVDIVAILDPEAPVVTQAQTDIWNVNATVTSLPNPVVVGFNGNAQPIQILGPALGLPDANVQTQIIKIGAIGPGTSTLIIPSVGGTFIRLYKGEIHPDAVAGTTAEFQWSGGAKSLAAFSMNYGISHSIDFQGVSIGSVALVIANTGPVNTPPLRGYINYTQL